MVDVTKKILTGLPISIVSVCNHTKCISLSNQICMTQPTIFNLEPNETVKNFTASHLWLN